MADLGKVIRFKRPRGAAYTIIGSGRGSGDPPPPEKVAAILNHLPVSITGDTPYGKLPTYLADAVRRNRGHCREVLERVKAGKIKPKAGHLLKLLTATQALGHRIKDVRPIHLQMVVDRMHRVESTAKGDLCHGLTDHFFSVRFWWSSATSLFLGLSLACACNSRLIRVLTLIQGGNIMDFMPVNSYDLSVYPTIVQ